MFTCTIFSESDLSMYSSLLVPGIQDKIMTETPIEDLSYCVYELRTDVQCHCISMLYDILLPLLRLLLMYYSVHIPPCLNLKFQFALS